MIKTSCYIVNFNAKEYLLKCIDSVVKTIPDDIEICVIDNASTDGSVEAVKSQYGNKIRCVVNSVNLGGAGGFNTALNDAVKNNREYAVLLDNDICVDESSINNMVDYLTKHSDVGAVGAKIMIMDRPDYIQEFGGHLDMNRYYFKTDYWYEKDNGTESEIESDWLSSCALATRVEAVKKTNMFPEENFIFWDDIQFTWEIKRAGYRLISLSNAKVWHKGKKKKATNTASAYYAMRNRTKFFSICEDEDKLELFCRRILEEYFDIIFGSRLKKLNSANTSRIFALDDFVNKRYGKARNEVIFDSAESTDLIEELCTNVNKVFIDQNSSYDTNFEGTIKALAERLDKLDGVSIVNDESEAQLIFVPCEHVKTVKSDILPRIWFDSYLNVISSDEDYKRIEAYPLLKKEFVDLHFDWLLQGIISERKR